MYITRFSYSRVQMLAGGHRSKAYCKRLVSTRVPMWETKLDAGVRILWTQLRRGVEKPAIMVSGGFETTYICACSCSCTHTSNNNFP
jgi:hypothetical protein